MEVSPAEPPPAEPAPPVESPAPESPTTEPPSAAEAVGRAEAAAREAAPPAPEPTPEEPAAATAGVGAVPRYLRSAAAGSCSECQPGEWAVASEQVAATTRTAPDPRHCPDTFVAAAREAVQLLADTAAARLDDYAGPVLTALFRLPPSAARERLQELLGPATDPESYCQLAGVVLPRSTAYTGYVLEAWDSLGGRTCQADVSCAVGMARWLNEPLVVAGAERVVVYSVFKNSSSRRERRARMTVYFQPPSPTWRPAGP
jgi:hypothetical protein